MRLTDMTSLLDKLRDLGSFKGADGTNYIIDVSMMEEFKIQATMVTDPSNSALDSVIRANTSTVADD